MLGREGEKKKKRKREKELSCRNDIGNFVSMHIYKTHAAKPSPSFVALIIRQGGHLVVKDPRRCQWFVCRRKGAVFNSIEKPPSWLFCLEAE